MRPQVSVGSHPERFGRAPAWASRHDRVGALPTIRSPYSQRSYPAKILEKGIIQFRFQSHQISDAVVAPHCSMTSGATGYISHISQTRCGINEVRWTVRTPVWTPDDRIITCCASGGCIARHPKIGELHCAVFGRQDVGALDVSVDHTLVV